jgi:glycerophosphoryl diester phosphodiesterase
LNGGHDDDRAVELNQKDESWGWLLEKGASLIQTDRPVQLLQYLKEEGRR